MSQSAAVSLALSALFQETGSAVPRAHACSMSDSWVFPALGSRQVSGAGPDDSAPWAAGRGQCLAAAEHAAARA